MPAKPEQVKVQETVIRRITINGKWTFVVREMVKK
jgi:hypothetical protein